MKKAGSEAPHVDPPSDPLLFGIGYLIEEIISISDFTQSICFWNF